MVLLLLELVDIQAGVRLMAEYKDIIADKIREINHSCPPLFRVKEFINFRIEDDVYKWDIIYEVDPYLIRDSKEY